MTKQKQKKQKILGIDMLGAHIRVDTPEAYRYVENLFSQVSSTQKTCKVGRVEYIGKNYLDGAVFLGESVPLKNGKISRKIAFKGAKSDQLFVHFLQNLATSTDRALRDSFYLSTYKTLFYTDQLVETGKLDDFKKSLDDTVIMQQNNSKVRVDKDRDLLIIGTPKTRTNSLVVQAKANTRGDITATAVTSKVVGKQAWHSLLEIVAKAGQTLPCFASFLVEQIDKVVNKVVKSPVIEKLRVAINKVVKSPVIEKLLVVTGALTKNSKPKKTPTKTKVKSKKHKGETSDDVFSTREINIPCSASPFGRLYKMEDFLATRKEQHVTTTAQKPQEEPSGLYNKVKMLPGGWSETTQHPLGVEPNKVKMQPEDWSETAMQPLCVQTKYSPEWAVQSVDGAELDDMDRLIGPQILKSLKNLIKEIVDYLYPPNLEKTPLLYVLRRERFDQLFLWLYSYEYGYLVENELKKIFKNDSDSFTRFRLFEADFFDYQKRNFEIFTNETPITENELYFIKIVFYIPNLLKIIRIMMTYCSQWNLLTKEQQFLFCRQLLWLTRHSASYQHINSLFDQIIISHEFMREFTETSEGRGTHTKRKKK